MKKPTRSICSKLTVLLCAAALLSGLLTLFMGTAAAGDCVVIRSEYIGCCYGGYYGQYLHDCADGTWEIVCYGNCQGPPP